MGIQHYPRSHSINDDNNYGSLPAELTSFTSSTFEPRQQRENNKINKNEQQSASSVQRQLSQNENFEFFNRRKICNTDVFGQNMKNLVQIDKPKCKFTKSLDEIREEDPRKKLKSVIKLEINDNNRLNHNKIKNDEQEFTRNLVKRHQSFDYTKYQRNIVHDSRTYDIKEFLKRNKNYEFKKSTIYDQESGCYDDTSDDESCEFDSGDFDDGISSCKSRSCCSVTTVANDDFEFFQRNDNKIELLPSKKFIDTKISMRSFTPKIIENNWNNDSIDFKKFNDKPIIQSYHLKKMSPVYSMNDLDKIYQDDKQPNLSISNLKNALKYANVSYLDNGEICRHSIGGSAPDLKKIFVTEFI